MLDKIKALKVRVDIRAPVAEDDIEAGVRQRHVFGAGLDQGKVHAGLFHEAARMLELPRRDIQAHGVMRGV